MTKLGSLVFNTPVQFEIERNSLIGIADGYYRSQRVVEVLREAGFRNIALELNEREVPLFVESQPLDLLILGDQLSGSVRAATLVQPFSMLSRNFGLIYIGGNPDPDFQRLVLEAGADCYIEDNLENPFNSRIFTAHIEALIRRLKLPTPNRPNYFENAGLRINFEEHRVELNGEALRLGPREFEFLELLARRPGRIVSKDEVVSLLNLTPGDWVRVLANRVRHRLGDSAEEQRYVQTVTPIGYLMPLYEKEKAEEDTGPI